MQEPSAGYQTALDQFILYWGEMASAWGINKTMAQIHALLYARSAPLDTDTIMEALRISRGNANMNLRNLVQWGLIHKIELEGQRKDYYTAVKDVWETAGKIIRERQRLEIAPIKENLKTCLDLLQNAPEKDAETQEFADRIRDFVAFIELFEGFTNAILPYVTEKNMKSLQKFVNLAQKRNLMKGQPEDYLPVKPFTSKAKK